MKLLNLIKCEFIKNFTFNKMFGTFLILLVSVIAITEFWEMSYNSYTSRVYELSSYQSQYQQYKDYPSEDAFEQEYMLYISQKGIETFGILEGMDVDDQSWQYHTARRIMMMNKQEFFIDKRLNGEEISLDVLKQDEILSSAKKILELDEDNLRAWKKEIEKQRSKSLELLEENKFYKYVQFQLELLELEKTDDYIDVMARDFMIFDDNKEYYQKIVDMKIADEEHYYVKNIYQRINNESRGYDSEYVKEMAEQYKIEVNAILEYSINNNMKHDLTSSGIVDLNIDYYYLTSKKIVNLILPISVVVMILIILTCGDIVSKEHTLGTEKMLMTSPNKRWKILLSKFIYMVLNMYIIWFTALILLSIYAGIKYGFNDLFTSKLIYQGGKVVEVNYYLYTIKQIFYVSIPVIALISIILMLSTVTLNNVITVGSTMFMSIISVVLWNFIQQFKLYFLAFTPLPYFMFSNVLNLNENYLKTVDVIKISESTGIIISIITIVICYFISHIIYTRRDVKN